MDGAAEEPGKQVRDAGPGGGNDVSSAGTGPEASSQQEATESRPGAVADPAAAGAVAAAENILPGAGLVVPVQTLAPSGRERVLPVLKVLPLFALGLVVFMAGADRSVGLMWTGIAVLVVATLWALVAGTPYEGRPQNEGLIKLSGVGALAVLFFVILASSLGSEMHQDSPGGQWDRCADSVRNAVDQNSAITGSALGDVAGAITAECGPRP